MEILTKEDLKTGMIVKLRNGMKLTVLLDADTNYHSEPLPLLVGKDQQTWLELDDYNIILNHREMAYDIVCVWKTSHPYDIMFDYSAGKRIKLYDRDNPVDFKKKPSWEGEGCPPVGTVCEILDTSYETNWEKAEILFVGESQVVYKIASGMGMGEYSQSKTLLRFQVLKTEKEKDIENMAEDLHGTLGLEYNKGDCKELAQILYTQGYRKHEDEKCDKV